MKNTKKKANQENRQSKNLLLQTGWLFLGSVSLLLIALLAEKYLRSAPEINGSSLTDSDDVLLETSGYISQASFK